MKVAQNELAANVVSLSKKNAERVNPSSVQVIYLEEEEMIQGLFLDCWSANMGLTIHGLKVHKLTDVNAEQPSVFYVLENSFNGILNSIFYFAP
jgi:hypothetical protein